VTDRAVLTVRRATTADAHAIAAINVASWQAAYRGIMPDDFLDGMSTVAREAALETRLLRDDGDGAPVWVAERGGVTIGFVSSGPPRDEDVPLPAAEVYAIYVMPEEWRGGAGKALLAAAVDHWLERGAACLVLWVLEANSGGRAFYEAMGWRWDGHRQELDFGGFATPELRYGRTR
jgi:GNAT superfamily N-acetyltransferase